MHDFSSYHTYLTDRLTLLRAACTTEAVIGKSDKGASCFFMVSGTNPRNGIIPSRSFGVAAPLEMIDLEASVESTSAELTIMGGLPHALVGPVNEQIERSIISALDSCTNVVMLDGGGSVEDMTARGLTVLGNNEAPVEDVDNMFALGTPVLHGTLHDHVGFAKAEIVNVKVGNQQRKIRRWAGLNWVFAPHLEHSYILHRHALGHALDFAALAVPGAVTGGIDPKTSAGWMKAKTTHLAAVLQPAGIVRIR